MLESRLKNTSSQNNLHNPFLLNHESSDVQGLEPVNKKNESKISENKNANFPRQMLY